jgi:hypothetical protein
MLYLVLQGCPQPSPQPAYICKADANWVSLPTQPSDVGEEESFCDFYQFGWQWFLAQTSPSKDDSDERVFEMHRVFHPKESNQCEMEIQLGREHNIKVLAPRINKSDLEIKQADQHALYDQNGNILYYNIWYSSEMCKATDNFVAGTLEIKASWIVLKKKKSNFFTIQTSDDQYLGLVGFHMAIWTPKHHEMLWYTWEHKNNAPLCDGSSEIQEYNFSSKSVAKCLAEKKDCTKYNINIPEDFSGEPPYKAMPNEVCRMFENGNQNEDAINGNNNPLNKQVIQDLNDQLVGEKGIISQLPNNDPMKVWSNYHMIGGIWTKNGKPSGTSPVPYKDGTGDKDSPQRGSLELTNMSMETFEQGQESFVPNCFGCHHYTEEKPLEVSHIFKYLK